MSSYPNRQTKIPRQGAVTQRYRPSIPERGPNWILWGVLGIGLAGALALIFWRLQVQEKLRATEKQVAALLVSADQLIQSDREDEAEAAMRKAFGLLPGDVRCQAVIERINTKREMIHQKKATASGFALAQAEQIALGDIALAIEAFGRIGLDSSFTAEAQRTAGERAKELKGGVCTLRLPADWPSDAILSIDGVDQFTGKNVVSGILPGTHKIHIKRFGYREPADTELEFRGLEPLQLPAFQWHVRGTKVSITSRPSKAAVWRDGKDTGKVTPCVIEDVDEGPIEFLLKHPEHADTKVKGEVKDRKPLGLSVTLDPLDAPST